ncbi:hypothetical protein B296_00051114, partial [Ensete ventricosum]
PRVRDSHWVVRRWGAWGGGLDSNLTTTSERQRGTRGRGLESMRQLSSGLQVGEGPKSMQCGDDRQVTRRWVVKERGLKTSVHLGFGVKVAGEWWWSRGTWVGGRAYLFHKWGEGKDPPTSSTSGVRAKISLVRKKGSQ